MHKYKVLFNNEMKYSTANYILYINLSLILVSFNTVRYGEK